MQNHHYFNMRTNVVCDLSAAGHVFGQKNIKSQPDFFFLFLLKIRFTSARWISAKCPLSDIFDSRISATNLKGVHCVLQTGLNP